MSAHTRILLSHLHRLAAPAASEGKNKSMESAPSEE